MLLSVFLCVDAYLKNHVDSAHYLERSSISTGFSNWKDATTKFSKHEASRCHKDSVLKLTTLPASTPDIGEVFATQLGKERLTTRKCFLKVVGSARFLARQGLALRGDGEEANSNFLQL